MNKFIQFCQMVGISPNVAISMFGVDWLLFGSESTRLGDTWDMSISVATVLIIPCVLVQKYKMREPWGLAIGKGVMVGILTAIPTPVPSIITIIGGTLGAFALRADRRSSSLDEKNE